MLLLYTRGCLILINEILSMFIDSATIEILGNWYPRVYAVMSCVIPFTFILGAFALIGLLIHESFRVLR